MRSKGLTKALALELPNKYRINAVAPRCATDMVDRFAGKEGDARLSRSVSGSGALAQREIAAAVLYLFRDAKFTTEHSLVVDGGMLAQ